MRKALFLLAIALLTICSYAQDTTEGTLFAVNKNGGEMGACPLKSTSVKADISGFLARVHVKQEFENSFSEPIEAVYTFPLSQNGAVDDMTMTIGSRVIRGRIMKREEARAAYETAKSAGQAASLLDQERPNIFTQAVANIMPGEKVVIEISYVETLKYEDGAYEFVFPMTVGPRYIPGSVQDAAKIRPPAAATRAGHDVSIEVNVNAGVPVEALRSTSHPINQINLSPNRAKVTLRDEKVIPNKDFILRYDVTGKRIEDAVLTHRSGRGGFFSLILQPPDGFVAEDRTPKEIVFVLDTSGSMSGFPIEKAKEAMKLSLEGLYPDDTFNLITFAGDTSVLFDEPVPATQANLERAQAFLDSRQGGGGTEMMKAIKAALDPSDSQRHLRIVCFMTDGYVGNDNEIIAEIQKHPKARIFSFGIGGSVNRFLLDKMAEEGNGEAEYVALDDDGSKAAKKFYERVRTPLLSDLSIDWNGMPVDDVYPSKLTDLFTAKPVIVNGRFTKAGGGIIKLKGKVAGQPYERSINISFPEAEAANDVLATLWARRRVDELSSEARLGNNVEALNTQITGLGLEFRILTQFTSFVAVEEQIVNPDGAPQKVEVPVQTPEGVNRMMASGVNPVVSSSEKKQWGDPNSQFAVLSNGTGSGGGGGGGTGTGTGSGSGSGNGSAPAGVPVSSAAVSAVVNVTASVEAVNTSDASIGTTISRKTVAQLPKGTTFSSLMTMSPGVRAKSLAGGFQIDGSSGSENTFIVDGTEVTNFRTGQPKSKNEASLEGRTVAVAEPVYPEAAKAKKVLGKVQVDINLNLSGTVTSAKAVSGPQLLRGSAEDAAMLSKFSPVFAEGRAVRVSGTILYDFKNAEVVEISLRKMKAEAFNDDDKKASAIGDKLHFWLFQVVMRHKNSNTAPTANESLFVKNGRAAVQITLTTDSAGAAVKLQELGFKTAPTKGSKALSGTIPVEKLAALAEIDEVKLVLPVF